MQPGGYDYGSTGGSQQQYGNPPPSQGQYGNPPPPAGGYGQPPQGGYTPPPQYGQPNVGGPYGANPGGDASRQYGQAPPPPPNANYGGYAPPPPQANPDYQAANDDNEAYQRTIMEQWDEHMSDFEPSDMLTINIPSRTDEIFYEYIQEIPSKVRGAYYIGSGEKKLIDFWIVDPSNRIFNTIQGKNEGLFIFEAKQPGIYQFVFANSRYWEAKDLTFAIHFGNNTDEHASAEHLDPMHESLRNSLKQVKNLYTEVKFLVGKQDSHYSTIKGAMSTNYWVSILETICIIGLTAAQIYFIKRILQHKRVL